MIEAFLLEAFLQILYIAFLWVLYNLCYFKINIAKSVKIYLITWVSETCFTVTVTTYKAPSSGSFYRGRSLKLSRVESVDKSGRNGATLN